MSRHCALLSQNCAAVSLALSHLRRAQVFLVAQLAAASICWRTQPASAPTETCLQWDASSRSGNVAVSEVKIDRGHSERLFVMSKELGAKPSQTASKL